MKYSLFKAGNKSSRHREALSSRGMTLMEILVVLVILGVIAGLAIPSFARQMEVSRAEEARVNLGVIHMGQRVFRANSAADRYWTGGNNIDITAATNAVNTALGTDIIGSFYPRVTITTSNADTQYTATMARAAGATVNWSFTIDENGLITCAGSGCPF